MCELLANQVSVKLGPAGYTAGPLSAFDLLLGLETAVVESTLVLDD
jgi:hypothetical protein